MKVTAGFHRILARARRQAETINPNDLQEALTRTEEKRRKSWKFAVNTLCWNTWHHHATKTHHLFIPANCMIFSNSFGTFSLATAIYSKLFLFAAAQKIQNTHLNSIIRSQNVRSSAGKKLSAPVYFRFRNKKITTCEISFPRRALNSYDVHPCHHTTMCSDKRKAKNLLGFRGRTTLFSL